jgi:hypothetical protein
MPDHLWSGAPLHAQPAARDYDFHFTRACRSLGQKVFSRPGAGAVKEEEQGWRDSLYRVYKSGQARAALARGIPAHACTGSTVLCQHAGPRMQVFLQERLCMRLFCHSAVAASGCSSAWISSRPYMGF